MGAITAYRLTGALRFEGDGQVDVRNMFPFSPMVFRRASHGNTDRTADHRVLFFVELNWSHLLAHQVVPLLFYRASRHTKESQTGLCLPAFPKDESHLDGIEVDFSTGGKVDFVAESGRRLRDRPLQPQLDRSKKHAEAEPMMQLPPHISQGNQ